MERNRKDDPILSGHYGRDDGNCYCHGCVSARAIEKAEDRASFHRFMEKVPAIVEKFNNDQKN
jgi:hypothetical protein